MSTTQEQQHTRSEEEIQHLLDAVAGGFGHPIRSPILKNPADYGLEFEEVTFPSMDGVPLEAWYIPREGSTKLIIANHPLWFNRYGLAAHLEPWKSIGALAGNDFEVDFVPDYRILHEAGYNVLTYDMRNLGHSGTGNGGIGSGGRFEARDVVGSLMYARSNEKLKGMTIGLFSRCQGSNATMFAMQWHPEQFEGVRCVVSPQPLSVRVTMQRTLELLGISDRIDELEEKVRRIVSFRFDEMSPVEAAKSVTIPTFLYQVHDDLVTLPSDVQAMFDNIPTAEKKLVWIHGTTARWDGYLHFQREPEQMLEWFETYMR
ncbi:alpha/beta hydrolase family protein [Streptomyces sp. NPDC056663]|uniref:alpha/beta hydrolase family protein n=1 Tax=Streptomyces sp. NPDC056663 TaxID=3345899 RepID=UPI0036CF6CB7